MTDRSELGDGKRQQHAEALTDNELAGAIIVAQRSSQNSAKLLPPILILMLATAFLAYRSARSSDWRGISAFFETQSPRQASAAPPLLARASEKLDAPVVTSESIAPEPPSATASPAEPKPVEATEVPAPPEPATNALPKVAETADPISDIAREAEKTKERIAELEKMKANESRKLEETAEERQREDNIKKRREMRLRGGLIGPEQIEKLLQAQEQMLRRQMGQMAQMQRRFLNEPGFGFGPGRMPNAGGFVPFGGQVRQGPNGGVSRFREFRGPNGMNGFTFEFRSGDPGADADADKEDTTPPPPPPRPRARQID